MQKYWILENEFGYEAGQVENKEDAPEGSKVFNNLNQLNKEEDKALLRVEQRFNEFLEQADEGIDDSDDRESDDRDKIKR